MNFIINEERLTAAEYIDFLKKTDLGVVREYTGQGVGKALVKRLHELAGGEKNIIMYTCVNEDAIPFYEKIGMTAPDDVMVALCTLQCKTLQQG